MIRNNIGKKLFLSPYFFTIALRRRTDKSILEEPVFQVEHLIPSSRNNWIADPFLIDDGDRTFLFYEAVRNNRGHGQLEVAEVFDDCTLGSPTVILSGSCHYSYPCVFYYEDAWYLIPESSADGEIQLYKARLFPYKWEKCSTLLNARAVDTTVIFDHEAVYLLTYVTLENSEKVIPHAYLVEGFPHDPTLKELPWTEFDSLRVRGAGPVFRMEDHLYRPAQISREDCYGDAVAFYESSVGEYYSEKVICELKPEQVIGGKGYIDGLHTYCRSDKYEAVDLRCREFDFWKVPRTLWNRMKR